MPSLLNLTEAAEVHVTHVCGCGGYMALLLCKIVPTFEVQPLVQSLRLPRPHQSWLLSFSDAQTGVFLNSRVFGYYKISFKTEVARILVVDAVGKTVEERRLGRPLLFSILFWHWSRWGFPTLWIFGCLPPASALTLKDCNLRLCFNY